MNRKILSNLIKVKDKLRETIKEKIPKQEKNPQRKTLQSIWDEQGERLSEGMKRAKKGMQGLGSKMNVKNMPDLLKEAKEINLTEKISKLTHEANQKAKDIKQPSRSTIQSLRKDGTDLIDKIKLLGKMNSNDNNSLQELKQSSKKQQKAIDKMWDKGKDTKQQNQFFMDFVKAKARDIDSRLKVISSEMKESSLLKKSSFLELLKGFIMNFYWRFIILVSFVAFAYGFGSSLPKEIRKALKGKEEKEKEKEKPPATI